jgi:Domain of unknown function (DUF5056)
MKNTDFDSLLREALSPQREHIADDGFTDAVLGKLPAPRTSPVLRYTILSACAAIAVVILLLFIPGMKIVTDAIVEFAVAATRLRMPSLVSIAVCGIILWGAVIPVRAALGRKL